MKPVLIVDNVTKKYKGKEVVSNLVFSLYEGEILGLVGPNGAGKSTTLKMITGLTSISSGYISICGHDIEKNFCKAMENIGAVVENPVMYNDFSGLKNLQLVAGLYGKEAKKRIESIVSLVGMTEKINEKYSTYSLGMKQRLGIASALLNNPKIVILDEPTNGLDVAGIKELRDLLIKLAKKVNIAIIVSSHNLSELEHICDKVGIISGGKLIEYKSITDIKDIYSKNEKVIFSVNYPNFAAKLLKDRFKINCSVVGNSVIAPIKEKHIAIVTSFLTMKKIVIYGIEKKGRSLEDIYFEILKKKVKNNERI